MTARLGMLMLRKGVSLQFWGAGLAAAIAVSIPPAAQAQALSGALLDDGTVVPLGDLQVGQQQVVENADGSVAFAGKQIELSDFTGLLGYSAEVAYLVVIDGSATVGERTARAGRMLILQPYGAPITLERFDATPLAARWSAEAAARHPLAFAELQSISQRQREGIFYGRLTRTSLNLAAPAGERAERARRSVVGEAVVRNLRYSGERGLDAIGHSVGKNMLAALARGDESTVTALLDPVPYGNTDLTGSGGDARRLTARTLMARHEWSRLVDGAALRPGEDSTSWIATSPAGSATINLRRMGDFVFVSSILVGDAQ